uniref:granzyme K-like n=1 Tax=Pristiophorus japonicus TaxID=55135 RepID=UPI00398EF0D7
MASIQVNKKHECGGVLIKPAWILTAAHCNLDFKYHQVEVVLGTDSLRKKEASQQVIKVKQKFPHPCFDKKSKENDIMLLQLHSEAKLDKFVKLLPLPKKGLDVKDGTVCTVVGWGTTNVKSNKLSDSLKEVNVTIINRKTCNSQNYYNRKPEITMNMLCAGDKKGGKDACNGDSGGPLICKKELRGIVSYGHSCGLRTKPGIYTRITESYIKWIQGITT